MTPEFEPEQFGAAFQDFLRWAQEEFVGGRGPSEVSALIGGFLAPDAAEHSVVTKVLAAFEHVNLQTALDAWSAEPGREVTVHGISLPPHHGPVGLQQLMSDQGMHHVRLSAPALVDLANGPGTTLACLRFAVLLIADARGRYVVLVRGPMEHDPRLAVEVAGLSVTDAQEVHARLEQLRRRLNVYRSRVLDVGVSEMGAVTHTTRYLVGQMAGCTRLVLTGRALHVIGAIAELARDLEPAMIVLEDVDLVAEHRTAGPGASPVLFDLLDAMDGAAPDADLLFVLTTNRADLLEPALAARPGRGRRRRRDRAARGRRARQAADSVRPGTPAASERRRAGGGRRPHRRRNRVISQGAAAPRRARGAARRPDDGLGRCRSRRPGARRAARHRPAAHAQPARRRQRPAVPPGRWRRRRAAAPSSPARQAQLRLTTPCEAPLSARLLRAVPAGSMFAWLLPAAHGRRGQWVC